MQDQKTAFEVFETEKASQDQFGGVGEHESIYKYVSLGSKRSWNYFEKTIHDAKLIGSTRRSLNDPFEAQPKFFDDLTDKKLRECCKYFDPNGDERDSYELRVADGIDAIKRKVRDSTDVMIEDARILSFCRRFDSPLLWSHYANSHTGACIHFSSSAFGKMVKKGGVQYTHSRPVIPLSLPAKILLPRNGDHHPIRKSEYRSELFASIFFRKPVDWAYEEEVRLVYSAAKATNIDFEPSGIFSVIVGARCNEEDKAKIRSIVKASRFDIRLQQASISKNTFGVDIDDA